MKNNRVHLLSTEIAWGPDGIVGLAYCAAWLHPGMDIDPEKIYREYLEQFLGVEYPEGAVLGYPEKERRARWCSLNKSFYRAVHHHTLDSPFFSYPRIIFKFDNYIIVIINTKDKLFLTTYA